MVAKKMGMGKDGKIHLDGFIEYFDNIWGHKDDQSFRWESHSLTKTIAEVSRERKTHPFSAKMNIITNLEKDEHTVGLVSICTYLKNRKLSLQEDVDLLFYYQRWQDWMYASKKCELEKVVYMNAVLVWWRRNAERYFIRWKLYSDMKKAREEANTVLILTPLIEVLKIRQAFRTWVVFYKAAVDMQAADDVWYSRALYEAFIHWTVFSKAILNMNTAKLGVGICFESLSLLGCSNTSY